MLLVFKFFDKSLVNYKNRPSVLDKYFLNNLNILFLEKIVMVWIDYFIRVLLHSYCMINVKT